MEGDFGKQLGLPADFVVQAVKAVGNYGELFERNVGQGSKLKLERGLNITEEVMRHLITRVERPQARRAASDAGEGMADDEFAAPPSEDEDEIPAEFIDESESEAAPAAADR